MEELNVNVLNGFDVKPQKITREKSYYILNVGDNLKVIKKSLEDEQNLVFQYEIKEQLLAKGFDGVERLYKTVEGEPYLRFDDELYYMSDFFPYAEADFNDREQVKRVIKFLAEFHKNAVGIKTTQQVSDQNLTKDSFQKKMAELKSVKKSISGQKRMSDFDVVLLKNFNYYADLLNSSLGLFDTDYPKLNDEALAGGKIAHLAIKDENILVSENRLVLTRFASAAYADQLNDIAVFVKQYIKTRPENPIPLVELLELYGRDFTKEELKILHLLLIYPDRFLAICNQYYSKKRSWIPGAIQSRMEALIENQPIFNSYIEGIEKGV